MEVGSIEGFNVITPRPWVLDNDGAAEAVMRVGEGEATLVDNGDTEGVVEAESAIAERAAVDEEATGFVCEVPTVAIVDHV